MTVPVLILFCSFSFSNVASVSHAKPSGSDSYVGLKVFVFLIRCWYNHYTNIDKN